MSGSSILSRSRGVVLRHSPVASSLRRFLPESIAVSALAPLSVAAHRLLLPWPASVAAALLISGVSVPFYRLTHRAAQHGREADAAALRMRRLYELTRRTLEMDLNVEPGPRLATLIHEIFELEGVALFDADLQEVYTAGFWKINPKELVQNVYHFGTSDDDRSTGISRRVIRLSSVPVGSLVVRGESTPLTNSAVAALIAITFDRYRSLANESRIESERQAEQLRATVLDSLAHDYKTPLTAIRAASSGLTEMGRLTQAQAELVALIDEQAALLSDLTTRLLTTARLEAADADEGSPGLALQTAPEVVDSLIEDAIASLADRAACTRIEIRVPDQPLLLDCDRRLIGMLLAQYLDNACKYAEFDSTITVRAEKSGNEVLFSVHSFGPVIPMADRERIFDRYFRSSASSAQAAGTGIGLSIAKRVALAHGGSAWVSSDEAEGNTFFAALPAHSSTAATSHATHDTSGAHPRAVPQVSALERSTS